MIRDLSSIFFVFEQNKYQSETWSNGKRMGSYVAKMYFLQVDESFSIYWCPMQK